MTPWTATRRSHEGSKGAASGPAIQQERAYAGAGSRSADVGVGAVRGHLTAIRDQLDSLLDEAARQELTLRETLAFLCQREIARKDERRIQMGTRIAHFPCIATLAGFDYAAQRG